MTLFFAAVLSALCISALCSLLEATLLSLTPSQIAELSNRRPRVAAIWQGFKRNIEQPIAVILMLNTAAHTIGATVAGAEFERLFGEKWLAGFSLLLTYLMLQFTEILPKTLGVTFNRSLAPVIATPLDTLVRLLTPALRFIHWVNRPFEPRKNSPGASPSIKEIEALASIARTAGSIDLQQTKLIKAASRLPELHARQIMTPRIDVGYLRLDQPIEEVLKTVRKSPWSRFPLCDGDLDHAVGLIHVRDLFKLLQLVPEPGTGETKHGDLPDGERPGSDLQVTGPGDFDLRKIMRPLLIVPEQAAVTAVLRQFQESRSHMAILVDEYGVTEGIVTLEDILEEMVGEIEDEFDLSSALPLVAEGDSHLLDGKVPLHELHERIGLAVEAEDVDTLGGLITERLGRLPVAGDCVRIGNFEARVEGVDRWRVTAVRLRPAQQSAGAKVSPVTKSNK